MSYTKLLAFSCFLLPVWMFGCSGSDPTPDASSGARACESAADCLDPLVEYCVLVDEGIRPVKGVFAGGVFS